MQTTITLDLLNLKTRNLIDDVNSTYLAECVKQDLVDAGVPCKVTTGTYSIFIVVQNSKLSWAATAIAHYLDLE